MHNDTILEPERKFVLPEGWKLVRVLRQWIDGCMGGGYNTIYMEAEHYSGRTASARGSDLNTQEEAFINLLKAIKTIENNVNIDSMSAEESILWHYNNPKEWIRTRVQRDLIEVVAKMIKENKV